MSARADRRRLSKTRADPTQVASRPTRQRRPSRAERVEKGFTASLGALLAQRLAVRAELAEGEGPASAQDFLRYGRVLRPGGVGQRGVGEELGAAMLGRREVVVSRSRVARPRASRRSDRWARRRAVQRARSTGAVALDDREREAERHRRAHHRSGLSGRRDGGEIGGVGRSRRSAPWPSRDTSLAEANPPPPPSLRGRDAARRRRIGRRDGRCRGTRARGTASQMWVRPTPFPSPGLVPLSSRSPRPA